MSKTGGISIYPERTRAIVNKVTKHLRDQGYKGVISQRTLRTEAYTANGQGEYILTLKDNAPRLSSGANREIRLKDQDAFVVTGFRMALLLETIAGPLGIERIHTFNSALPFADEAGGFQNAHLSAVYNGSMFLKVGDTVYLEDYQVEDCYVARTQQETAALKNERIMNDAYVDITPQFALRGFDSNDLRFKMPNAIATQKIQYNATSKVVLVFQFRGLILTGAGADRNLNLSFANE